MEPRASTNKGRKGQILKRAEHQTASTQERALHSHLIHGAQRMLSILHDQAYSIVQMIEWLGSDTDGYRCSNYSREVAESNSLCR